MGLKIQSLSIKGFRTFRELKIDGLGRVNLITGRNNTGKSSVLEALRILASDASPYVINDILRLREEYPTSPTDDLVWSEYQKNFFQWTNLFNGYPKNNVKPKAIEIFSTGSVAPIKISISIGWYTKERLPDGSSKTVLNHDRPFEGIDSLSALFLTSGENTRLLPLHPLPPYQIRDTIIGLEVSEATRIHCVFVSPYGGEQTSTLGALWDKIALSDGEDDVVSTMRIIDSHITKVSLIGDDGPRQYRTAIVRADNLPRPVPLRSFGDGLNRLFGIALSLVNAKDGLLLIDEFENGMHHTVQTDVWRAIFQIASRLDVQVVATSHSWDAVEAFQKAASETPEEGVLVRLTRKGEEIIPTLFREDELAIATRERIEVR